MKLLSAELNNAFDWIEYQEKENDIELEEYISENYYKTHQLITTIKAYLYL